ncbi:MAG TPA: DUF6703 family protein [Natronosporangium sp.]
MTPNDDRANDPLAKLAKLHPTGVVFATLALFLGVLLLPDQVGGVLILVIVAGLAWLLSRTWPVLTGQARVLRLLVIALLIAVAAVKLLG